MDFLFNSNLSIAPYNLGWIYLGLLAKRIFVQIKNLEYDNFTCVVNLWKDI